MRVTANFNKKLLNVSGLMGNIKADIARSLTQSTTEVKKNIKSELRSPNKTGTVKTSRRFRSSPGRRSAPGESLARDSGRSERLISSSGVSGSKSEVGFLENPNGYNYIAGQEELNNRPTMEIAIKKSLPRIQKIFESNLRPK